MINSISTSLNSFFHFNIDIIIVLICEPNQSLIYYQILICRTVLYLDNFLFWGREELLQLFLVCEDYLREVQAKVNM